jgi:hypothetical protein
LQKKLARDGWQDTRFLIKRRKAGDPEQDAISHLEDADDESDNRSIAGSKRKRSFVSRTDKKPKYDQVL